MIYPIKDQHDDTNKDYRTEQGTNKVADEMFQHFFPASAFQQQKHITSKKIDNSTQRLVFDPMTEFLDVFSTTKLTKLPPLCHINYEINIIDDETHQRMKPR